MTSRTTLAAALAAAAALALPAAASAKARPDHAAGHGKTKTQKTHADHGRGHKVSYLLRGTWSGGSLTVTGGNAHTRRAGLVGQTLALDLADARVKVHDANGDGARDAEDLQDGDRVVVQARGPRGASADDGFTVRKLVDRGAGNESGDDAQQGGDDPAGTDDDPSATTNAAAA